VQIVTLALIFVGAIFATAEVSVIAITEELAQPGAARFVIGGHAVGSFASGWVVGHIRLGQWLLGVRSCRHSGAANGAAWHEGALCQTPAPAPQPQAAAASRSGAAAAPAQKGKQRCPIAAAQTPELIHFPPNNARDGRVNVAASLQQGRTE
jgi:hypothetical protein